MFMNKLIVLFMLLVVLNSCVFTKLKEDIETMQTMTSIGGNIYSLSPHKEPLVLVIYLEADGQKHIMNFKILDKEEEFYIFSVPQGDYYIIAFEDTNYNLRYDAGEYFGQFGQPDHIRVAGSSPIGGLNIGVGQTEDFPDGFPTDISNVKALASINDIAVGTITTLMDDKFSEENSVMGFWQPMTALYTIGAGLYFLEEYDSNKIPILFVHGASGSPRNFLFLAENIDRSRYQPWFYHYPSGFPLEKISRFLNALVTDLHDTYQFKQMYVTAHSIGGLVSRSFINKNKIEDGNNYIKLFVTILSPFGGLETALMGVEHAPEAIPSWHDVVPGSPFIKDIFSQSLKSKLDYYLLFSHKGDNSMFMDNNDGTVTLRSQLDMRAQKDAIERWGFDEGHVSILSSQDVFEIFTDILEKTSKTN